MAHAPHQALGSREGNGAPAHQAFPATAPLQAHPACFAVLPGLPEDSQRNPCPLPSPTRLGPGQVEGERGQRRGPAHSASLCPGALVFAAQRLLSLESPHSLLCGPLETSQTVHLSIAIIPVARQGSRPPEHPHCHKDGQVGPAMRQGPSSVPLLPTSHPKEPSGERIAQCFLPSNDKNVVPVRLRPQPSLLQANLLDSPLQPSVSST